MRKIRTQLILMVVLISLVASAALVGVSMYSIFNLKSIVLDKSEEQLLKNYDEKIRNLVENTKGILEYNNQLYESGKITLETAQDNAKEQIRAIRYGAEDVGYFWIDNEEYILQLLPPTPAKEGQFRGNLEDKTGSKLVKKLVDGAVADGHVYVDYFFPKPGEEEASKKRGYTEYFKPWGWIIGTGNYIDDIDLVVNEFNAEINNEIKSIVLSFALVFLGIIILVIIMGTFFSNKLSKGINIVKESIEKIANNDLTGDKLVIDEKNELGDLKKFYNDMKDHLSNFVGFVNTNSKEIELSLGDLAETSSKNEITFKEITDAVNEVTEATVDQAENTENVANKIDDLTVDIENLYTNSKGLNEKVISVNDLNIKGIEKISALASWSQKTLESSQSVSKLIRNMDENSKMIEGVTETISAIAEQTNLLALNASIEAARAGEAGRGFSVVADEIRKLAEETAKSTDEIKNKVGSIINATENAVTSMNSTEEIIKKNNTAVEETEEIFHSISVTIDNITKSIDEIFSIADKMENKKENILDSTNSISSSSEEISASSEEVSASAEGQLANMENMINEVKHLSEMSVTLAEKIAEFKI